MSRALLEALALTQGLVSIPPRPEPQPLEEARRLVLAVGCSYEHAATAFLRLGEERALELLTVLREAQMAPTPEILDLVDPPRVPTSAQLESMLKTIRGIDRAAPEPIRVLKAPEHHGNRHERRAAAKRARSRR